MREPKYSRLGKVLSLRARVMSETLSGIKGGGTLRGIERLLCAPDKGKCKSLRSLVNGLASERATLVITGLGACGLKTKGHAVHRQWKRIYTCGKCAGRLMP